MSVLCGLSILDSLCVALVLKGIERLAVITSRDCRGVADEEILFRANGIWKHSEGFEKNGLTDSLNFHAMDPTDQAL